MNDWLDTIGSTPFGHICSRWPETTKVLLHTTGLRRVGRRAFPNGTTSRLRPPDSPQSASRIRPICSLRPLAAAWRGRRHDHSRLLDNDAALTASVREAGDSEQPSLLDPRDELPAGRMPIVDEESWPVMLDLIERQLDPLRVEFSVVEKGQLAQPDESAAVARVVPPQPIRYGYAYKALGAACIEDDCMERVEWDRDARPIHVCGRFSKPHVKEWLFTRESCA
jgi:hypothetical protein